MPDLELWTKKLREPEQELAAATKRSAVNAAAKKLMLAKAQLKRLEAKPRPSRGSRSADASS